MKTLWFLLAFVLSGFSSAQQITCLGKICSPEVSDVTAPPG